jgi:hypothetical protein
MRTQANPTDENQFCSLDINRKTDLPRIAYLTNQVYCSGAHSHKGSSDQACYCSGLILQTRRFADEHKKAQSTAIPTISSIRVQLDGRGAGRRAAKSTTDYA